MRFSTLFVSLLGALQAVAQTANPSGANPIIQPGAGASISAGTTTTITWTATTPGSITLTLRYGPSQNLATGTVIAAGIPNSGSYSWSVPGTIGNGQYTIEISTADGTANYSPSFAVVGGSGVQGGTTSASATTKGSSTTSSSSSTSDSTTTSTTSKSSSSSTTSTTSRSSSSTTSSAPTKAPSSAAQAGKRIGSGLAAIGLGAFALVI